MEKSDPHADTEPCGLDYRCAECERPICDSCKQRPWMGCEHDLCPICAEENEHCPCCDDIRSERETADYVRSLR